MNSSQKQVCVGRIRSPHGVRGLVHVESYMQDPISLFEHKTLRLENGTPVSISLRNKGTRGSYIAAIEGVEGRETAQAFIGVELYVLRAELPDLEHNKDEDDEFYVADLIGLKACLPSGETFGTVCRAPDFGGGVLLEIEYVQNLANLSDHENQLDNQNKSSHKNKTILLPFTVHHVPKVNLEAGFVTVILPAEIETES